mmetsp:Transcript_6381/g.15509  ORF Transcript_6381/g.15509 Transcript_6381/m.15509 type:complete len:109 (+) Transcript_6381:24-350(+)
MRRGLWSTLEGRLRCTEQWQFRLKRSLQLLHEVPVNSESAELEQYATPHALAARWITCLRLLGDIDEKSVVRRALHVSDRVAGHVHRVGNCREMQEAPSHVFGFLVQW